MLATVVRQSSLLVIVSPEVPLKVEDGSRRMLNNSLCHRFFLEIFVLNLMKYQLQEVAKNIGNSIFGFSNFTRHNVIEFS